MDVVSLNPVNALAEAYCQAEHGGHRAGGPMCEFGRGRARRILAALPESWRLVGDGEPDDTGPAIASAIEPWRQALQASAVLAHVEARHLRQFNECRFPACTEATRLFATLREGSDAADAEDQKPGGYVSRRPVA